MKTYATGFLLRRCPCRASRGKIVVFNKGSADKKKGRLQQEILKEGL